MLPSTPPIAQFEKNQSSEVGEGEGEGGDDEIWKITFGPVSQSILEGF
jgi:hypothetical protein